MATPARHYFLRHFPVEVIHADSYPALLLYRLDKRRPSHGLRLDDVVVKKQLDVVHR